MNYQEGLIKNTEFFTTSELAEKLKMNVQVVTRKVQAGEIQAYKIGKDWRIPEQSVFEWLERNSNTTRTSKKTKHDSAIATSDKQGPLPVQRSKRKYLLEYILAHFESNRVYEETEVNRIISRYHDDYAAVRREFVAENMMEQVNGKYSRRADYRLSD